MSAAEETLKPETKKVSNTKSVPILNRILNFLSSVRFGVVLLCILVFLSFLGMIIIQQNVNGFDAYFASLTPAESKVYGFLGLFDIYHSWYFNFLLLVLSLNIVLASIDRFPSAWSYIIKPKLTATRGWLLRQKQNAVIEVEAENEKQVVEKIKSVFAANGFSPLVTDSRNAAYASDKSGKKNFSAVENLNNKIIFGQTGKLNRLGAYIVHVFLLTLFLGHFVALQTGFDADVRLMPGDSTKQIELVQFNLDKKEKFAVGLPFTINCLDIQQKLIDPNGSIEVSNTLDWRTRIEIDDPEYGKTVADVSLNNPFQYRGYRFFQASAITLGSARTMTLELTPASGGEKFNVELQRGKSVDLPDGTKAEYVDFLPDFAFDKDGKPATRSADYNNPAVVLNITEPNGDKKRAYAFAMNLPDSAPVGAPVAGYKWHLANFEKSPYAHVLSIKYDPYNAAFIAWCIGGIGLIGALGFVFFFSHRRIWALIEQKSDNIFEIVLGGDANRNGQALEDKFDNLKRDLIGTPSS